MNKLVIYLYSSEVFLVLSSPILLQIIYCSIFVLLPIKRAHGMGVLRKFSLILQSSGSVTVHSTQKLQKHTENVNTKSILASTQAHENISAFLQKVSQGAYRGLKQHSFSFFII